MKTGDLIEQLSNKTGMDRRGVKAVVDGLVDALADAATRGEEVVLTGFGRFKVRDVAARQGRNPHTGEAIEVAAGRKLAFSPAKPLKDALKTAPASAAGGATSAGADTAGRARSGAGLASSSSDRLPAPRTSSPPPAGGRRSPPAARK